MKDLNELIGVLRIELNKEDKNAAFEAIVNEIASFYMDNLGLEIEEVAIFLTNDDKTVLSFAHPRYLVNAGMIPVNSTEAIAASVFRRGVGVIENNLQQKKHLSIFEIIPLPDEDKSVKLLWKMMGCVIAADGEKVGVIELSRRAKSIDEAGPDFDENELRFLVNSIQRLAPFIKAAMPENFRGKVT